MAPSCIGRPADVDILTAFATPELFGDAFAGETREAMRAVLAGAFAVPMEGKRLDLFRELSGGREPPSKRVGELWVIAGRRSDKTHTAAGVAVYLATVGAEVEGLADKLTVGERGVIALVAVDKAQAKVAMQYLVGLLQASQILAAMIERIEAEAVHLNNRISIEISAGNFRSIRGRTLLAVLLDECAFYRSEQSAFPDIELYRAAVPGLATTGGMLIGISSPYAKRGLLYDKFRKHFGQNGDVLVVKGPTRIFNPTVAKSLIDRAIAEDPEGARSEWLGEFRDDIAAFIDRATVEACTRSRPLELPYDSRQKYHAHVDPAGGGQDEYCIAIGHREGERLVVDVVRGMRGVPAAITAEYAELLKQYRISKISGDRYAGSWPADEFKKHHIDYEPAEKVRADLYRDLLPVLNSGGIELPPCSKLANQLASLERRTARSGKDVIDHPIGGHDDRANVVAGLSSIKRGSGYCVACLVHGTEGCPIHGQNSEPKTTQERPRPVPQRDHPANIF